jgi:hypothetical protein
MLAQASIRVPLDPGNGIPVVVGKPAPGRLGAPDEHFSVTMAADLY